MLPLLKTRNYFKHANAIWAFRNNGMRNDGYMLPFFDKSYIILKITLVDTFLVTLVATLKHTLFYATFESLLNKITTNFYIYTNNPHLQYT